MFTRRQAFVDRAVEECENGRLQRELDALQFKGRAHGFGLVNVQNPALTLSCQEFGANPEQFVERPTLRD
jgi:hypothetical protein